MAKKKIDKAQAIAEWNKIVDQAVALDKQAVPTTKAPKD